MDTKVFEKKCRKAIWLIRLYFWIPEFSIDTNLNVFLGDNEDPNTMLIRRSDMRGRSYVDIRNAIFLFVSNVPPEIGKHILIAGQNGYRAAAENVAPLLRKSEESTKECVERILSNGIDTI
jgi:hypothetical protein